jgi:hypothetical protein
MGDAFTTGGFALLGVLITELFNLIKNRFDRDERLKTQRERYREILIVEKLKSYETLNKSLADIKNTLAPMLAKGVVTGEPPLDHIHNKIFGELRYSIQINQLLMPKELRIEVSKRIDSYDESFTEALKKQQVDYNGYRKNIGELHGTLMALLYNDLGVNELASKPDHLLNGGLENKDRQ